MSTLQPITAYTATLQLNPSHEEALFNRGVAYFQTQQYPQALADFNQMLRINPGIPNAWFSRSLIHHAQQNFKAALDDALKAQELGYPVDNGYIDLLKNGL